MCFIEDESNYSWKYRKYTLYANLLDLYALDCFKICIFVVPLGVFDLKNGVIHHLPTPHFFIWFMEWDGLINHQFIPL
jgi:hypothetical protein